MELISKKKRCFSWVAGGLVRLAKFGGGCHSLNVSGLSHRLGSKSTRHIPTSCLAHVRWNALFLCLQQLTLKLFFAEITLPLNEALAPA
jgi:hypothetical protein